MKLTMQRETKLLSQPSNIVKKRRPKSTKRKQQEDYAHNSKTQLKQPLQFGGQEPQAQWTQHCTTLIKTAQRWKGLTMTSDDELVVASLGMTFTTPPTGGIPNPLYRTTVVLRSSERNKRRELSIVPRIGESRRQLVCTQPSWRRRTTRLALTEGRFNSLSLRILPPGKRKTK